MPLAIRQWDDLGANLKFSTVEIPDTGFAGSGNAEGEGIFADANSGNAEGGFWNGAREL